MKLIEKFINLIKETKKVNLESIMYSTEKINKEVDEIFSQALGTEEISVYKLELLNKKIELLEKQLNQNRSDFEKYCVDVRNLDFYRFWIEAFAIFVNSTLLVITQQYIIFWIIFFIYTSSQIYTTSLLKNCKTKEKDTSFMLESRKNAIFSCKNILGKKLKVKKEKIEEESKKEDYCITLLANKIISDYLDNKSLNIPSKEVEEEMIKILQFELETSETEIISLLEMANCKSANLAEDISRTRVLPIGENNEKNRIKSNN